MKKVMITGGAGFIGSHLADRLVEKYDVVVLDNLSKGKKEYVNDKSQFIKDDLTNLDSISGHFVGVDAVFHIAANPDVSMAAKDTKTQIDQNIIATYNVLEAMKANEVSDIVFTSSSTVYGIAKMPTKENYGPLIPHSIYGASKLSCEALISSYCHSFDMNSWVYRFSNIIGGRSTHGIIPDLIKKLKINNRELEILGNGQQTKSYCYIEDCIDAMVHAYENSIEKVNIFNIGSKDTISAIEIAKSICDIMGLNPKFNFTGGDKGWVGDIPKMLLSVEKIGAMGWEPKYNSRQAVERTIREIFCRMSD